MKIVYRILFILLIVSSLLSYFGCFPQWGYRHTQTGNMQTVHAQSRATERFYNKTFKIPSIALPEFFSIWQESTAVIVDARTRSSFEYNHIPSAVNLPVNALTSDEYTQFANSVDKNKKIIIYCSSEECKASEIVATLLIENGFSNVYHYPGGIAEWKIAGYPLVQAD